EGGLASLHGGVLRAGAVDAAARILFSVHRAVRRGGHQLRTVPGAGMSGLQAERLARDRRLRHGASEGVRVLGRGPRALYRLGLRLRRRAARDAALSCERSASVLRERSASAAELQRRRPMKVPLSWLRDWVDWPAAWDAAELARRLTFAGFEVESQAPAAPTFGGVVVARIIEVEPHPRADKLRICRASIEPTAALQIVCGAANARAGLVSALATVGATLPNGSV